MSDKVEIKGLKVFGYHGATDHERAHGQDFVVDVEASTDLKPSAESDDLEDTIDYDPLVKEIQRIVATQRFRLLETLASRIADVVLERKQVVAVRVKVAKTTPPIEADLDHVAVEIERKR